MNRVAEENKGRQESVTTGSLDQTVEVFGFQVPVSSYYLHQGHAWALVEENGRVRVGMDDFSQKILGPADELDMPKVGNLYYQDHVCMALVRQGHKAKVLAPVDGLVEEVNPLVQQQPKLVHDDPYGAGWLFRVKPTNLKHNLDKLYSGDKNATWIDQESHRLLNFMDNEIGVTLPSGGAIIDDVYGHFPQLGWRRLVREFFLQDLTRTWKKRY
jgi:glycine cleavage system H lipoate-binding protein